METVRLRIIGNRNHAAGIITVLHGLEGIEHIEEVADLMPHMDDDDSSSAGLCGDAGAGLHAIEVDVGDRVLAERVREVAGAAAELLGSSLEFVDEF
jgi:hypothetical protein